MVWGRGCWRLEGGCWLRNRVRRPRQELCVCNDQGCWSRGAHLQACRRLYTFPIFLEWDVPLDRTPHPTILKKVIETGKERKQIYIYLYFFFAVRNIAVQLEVQE